MSNPCAGGTISIFHLWFKIIFRIPSQWTENKDRTTNMNVITYDYHYVTTNFASIVGRSRRHLIWSIWSFVYPKTNGCESMKITQGETSLWEIHNHNVIYQYQHQIYMLNYENQSEKETYELNYSVDPSFDIISFNIGRERDTRLRTHRRIHRT